MPVGAEQAGVLLPRGVHIRAGGRQHHRHHHHRRCCRCHHPLGVLLLQSVPTLPTHPLCQPEIIFRALVRMSMSASTTTEVVARFELEQL